jgi:hypothetical protein
MGLFSGGNSSSTSNNYDYNTYNTNDNRQALGEGAIGASGGGFVNYNYSPTDNRSVSTTTIDPGALRAMETAMLSNNAVSQSAIASANSTAAAAAAAAQRASADAVSSATTTQRQALDFATGANATNAAGFSNLLKSGLDMFRMGTESIQKATSDGFNLVQATNAGLTGAYQTATAEKSGNLDNKTIMIIAVVGAAALAYIASRKG